MDLINSFLSPARTQRPTDKSVAQSQESPSGSPTISRSGSFSSASSSEESSVQEKNRRPPAPPKDKERETLPSGSNDFTTEMFAVLRNIQDAISELASRVSAVEESKSSRVPAPKELPPDFPSSSLKSMEDKEQMRKKRRETIFGSQRRRLDFEEDAGSTSPSEGTSLPSDVPPPFTSSPGLVSFSSPPPSSGNATSTPELTEVMTRYLIRKMEAKEEKKRKAAKNDRSLQLFVEEFVDRERTRSEVNEDLGIVQFTPDMRENPGFAVWYRRLDQIFRTKQYSEEQGMETLIHYTHPDTRDWMEDLKDDELNLKSYLYYFNLYWNPRTSKDELQDEFEEYFQETSQRIEDYAKRKIRLFRRAYPNRDHETSSQFRRRFVKGLLPVWYTLLTKKNLLSSDYPTIYAFLLKEQKYSDNISSHRRLHENRAKSTKKSPTKTPKESDASRKTTICPYFARGTCKKGNRCDMKHSRLKKDSSPDSTSKNPKSDKRKSDSSFASRSDSTKKSPLKLTPEQLAAPCTRTSCDKADGHILGKCPKWKHCPKCNQSGHHSSYCSKK